MHYPRVYIDESIECGEIIQLQDKSRHHLVNVLRAKIGDKIYVFNGQSNQQALAEILTINRKKLDIKIIQFVKVNRESPQQITLIQAISKNDKMDFSIQKSVELGVSVIQPVYTEKSARPLADSRTSKRMAHWQQIIISATEQSGRTQCPQLCPPIPLTNFLKQRDDKRTAYILDPNAQTFPHHSAQPSLNIEVAIGPESGFTPSEVNAAKQAGMVPIGMGPRVLRTETATVVALTWLQISFGDLPLPGAHQPTVSLR